MNPLRKMLLIALSVLLTINIIIINISFMLKFKAFNPDLYISLLNKYSVYSDTKNFLQNKLVRAVKDVNLPESTADNVITTDWVKKQYENIIISFSGVYTGDNYDIPNIDTTEPKQNFANNLSKVLPKAAIDQDSIRAQEIDNLYNLDSVFKDFSNVNFSIKLKKAITFFYSYFYIFIISFAVLLILCWITSLNKGTVFKPFIAGGMICLIPALICTCIGSNAYIIVKHFNIPFASFLSQTHGGALFMGSILKTLGIYVSILSAAFTAFGLLLYTIFSKAYEAKKPDLFRIPLYFQIKNNKKTL